MPRNQAASYQNNSEYPAGYQYRRSYGQNDSNNYYDDNECDPCCSNGCWDTVKNALIIGAAAVGGGVVGALIVKDGHDGDDGDTGPAGPTGATGPSGAGFIEDTGQSLTFTISSLFPASPAGSVTVIPFITTPNGVTIEGPSLISPTLGGTINFAPIVVSNPVFGFYNFGLSILNTSATTLAGITLNGTLVTASRDASVTSELTPLAGVSIAPGESQVSNTFTYGPANVP